MLLETELGFVSYKLYVQKLYRAKIYRNATSFTKIFNKKSKIPPKHYFVLALSAPQLPLTYQRGTPDKRRWGDIIWTILKLHDLFFCVRKITFAPSVRRCSATALPIPWADPVIRSPLTSLNNDEDTDDDDSLGRTCDHDHWAFDFHLSLLGELSFCRDKEQKCCTIRKFVLLDKCTAACFRLWDIGNNTGRTDGRA